MDEINIGDMVVYKPNEPKSNDGILGMIIKEVVDYGYNERRYKVEWYNWNIREFSTDGVVQINIMKANYRELLDGLKA